MSRVMPMANLPDNIYWGLSARARYRWPQFGFNDKAAILLAQLLGITSGTHQSLQWEKHYLQRSQWFDQRCRDFFRRYPHAMCIDLGAGLSTRFHRLSQQSDWPRFCWVDVDLPDVIQLKSRVMPTIDNYRLIGANILKDNWFAESGWHKGIPLIITLESVITDLGLSRTAYLLSMLKNRAAGATIEIVFDYTIGQAGWRRIFRKTSTGKDLLTLIKKAGFNILRLDQLPGKQTWGVSACLST